MVANTIGFFKIIPKMLNPLLPSSNTRDSSKALLPFPSILCHKRLQSLHLKGKSSKSTHLRPFFDCLPRDVHSNFQPIVFSIFTKELLPPCFVTFIVQCLSPPLAEYPHHIHILPIKIASNQQSISI